MEQCYQCYDCGKEIIFDNNFVSKNGKKIPLTKASKKPHQCKNKPFNKQTRRQWWEQQRQKAEGNREKKRNNYIYSNKQDEYYKLLGVTKGCTESDIKNAWRK